MMFNLYLGLPHILYMNIIFMDSTVWEYTYYPSLVACKSCTISLLIQVFEELNLKAYDLNVDNLDVHAVSLSYTHLLLLFPDSSQASLSLKRSLGVRL